MRIGIDARMSGPNVGGGGLGRYVEELVKHLPTKDQKNRYVLFESELGSLKDEEGIHVKTNIKWYTLKEQIVLPRIIDSLQLDLIHFPHWNVPLFLKTPFIVTIHDLILLEEPRSARATRLHPLIYWLKYAGFKRVLAHAVRASKKIIAVSQTTKSSILKHFPDINEDKIVVIYEGTTTLEKSTTQRLNDFPYILYVGNTYPHKNLEKLLLAFDLLHIKNKDIHLIFAGRDDVFSRSLEKQAKQISAASFVHFIRDPDDNALAQLYTNALAYVFPSRVEGFGLPPLEAMSMGVPVACSNIPALREILSDAPVYFNPNDPNDIADKIASILNEPQERLEQIKKGKEQAKLYSFEKMTDQIVHLYESCAKS